MWQELRKYLNFYRIHLLSFTLVPLFFALIFWASNGRFHIQFIDALFVCLSAATGTGLTTIDLSSLTAWQQTILVILQLTGNQVFVSWLVVYIRRRYFRQHLGHVISAEMERTLTRKETYIATASLQDGGRRSATAHQQRSYSNTPISSDAYRVQRRRPNGSTAPGPIRADMVRRRMDVAPRPVDPMGVPARTATVEDNSPTAYSSARSPAVQIPTLDRRSSRSQSRERPRPQTETGFGGFPGPADAISGISNKLFPRLHRNMQRTLTIPRTATLIPHDHSMAGPQEPAGTAKRVPYLSFIADVGANSHFHHLTEDQMIELGGVEYRALNSLMWITPLYYLVILSISIIIVTPYMCLPKWRSVYLPPMQHRKISPVWFSIFEVIGGWANTGMSLVDQNMIPFRTAYLTIVVLIFCVLAGGTAYPVFFRFTIWFISKCLHIQSRTRESLQFLLDHPRRCFITLFPSHQTWLLLFVLVLMNTILFAGDLILNIGNPATEAIPVGTRIALAFLSAAAVRSAGFQGVPISALVPAVQVLYVIMMYIAVYPVAMSVRATNVYEEKSLGVYDSEEDLTEPVDGESDPPEHRVAIWGRHLMRHMRRQLSFDIWWLALSLLLICIIERGNLMNSNNTAWFTVFAVLFELVSGYGTVGLSLGLPYANYSLSGAFHTLSKLIICAVMLRGRHRGLPEALDRSVMLPREFRKSPDATPDSNQPVPVHIDPQVMSELPERSEEASSSTQGSRTQEGDCRASSEKPA